MSRLAAGSSVVINGNQINKGNQLAVTVIGEDYEDIVEEAIDDFEKRTVAKRRRSWRTPPSARTNIWEQKIHECTIGRPQGRSGRLLLAWPPLAPSPMQQERQLCRADRQRAGHEQPYALYRCALLHGASISTVSMRRRCRRYHLGRQDSGLHRQGRHRDRSSPDPGRCAYGDVRARQGRLSHKWSVSTPRSLSSRSSSPTTS